MTTREQSRPSWVVLVRDIAVFVLGFAILASQAGLPPFEAPKEISIPLLAIGALCCNVPGILQAMAWRFGTAVPVSGQEPPPAATPSREPSSEVS